MPLMLTDAEGLVLDRRSGDTTLLRALDAVHLAPGFSYAEREAGTNGLGLALADRVPSVVRAEEHYSASLCTYTCAAVPVLDPLTGMLEGSVNITTWARSSSDLLLALGEAMLPLEEPARIAATVAEEAFTLAEALPDPTRAARAAILIPGVIAGTDCGFSTQAGMGNVASDVV